MIDADKSSKKAVINSLFLVFFLDLKVVYINNVYDLAFKFCSLLPQLHQMRMEVQRPYLLETCLSESSDLTCT